MWNTASPRRRLLACLAVLPLLWHARPQAQTQAQAQTQGRPEVSRQRRIALVIGNARYPEMPLNNPEQDARLIAQTLRSLDFEVSRGAGQSSLNVRPNSHPRLVAEHLPHSLADDLFA